MATNFDAIKKAILTHQGGLETATDEQIVMIWNSLNEKTQKEYLKTDTPKPVGAVGVTDNAHSPRPDPNV